MDKNSGTESDVEVLNIKVENPGAEDTVVIIPRQLNSVTGERFRSNSPEPVTLNHHQGVASSQGSSTDCKIIFEAGPSDEPQAGQLGSCGRKSPHLRQVFTSAQLSSADHDIVRQPGTSVMAREGRRGSSARRSRRFSGVKEHGSGAETNRVWPEIRRGTSKSAQLEYVEKVTELDRTSRDGILVTITDKGSPDVPARVEHYEYWKVRNSRRAMKDFFDSRPDLKAVWIRWNRKFVMEAYKTEDMVNPQSGEEED